MYRLLNGCHPTAWPPGLGPQRAYLLRQDLDDVANLTWGDMVLQGPEYRTRGILSIDWLPGRDARGYPIKELVTRADLIRFSRGMPCLVIDTADQHW